MVFVPWCVVDCYAYAADSPSCDEGKLVGTTCNYARSNAVYYDASGSTALKYRSFAQQDLHVSYQYGFIRFFECSSLITLVSL